MSAERAMYVKPSDLREQLAQKFAAILYDKEDQLSDGFCYYYGKEAVDATANAMADECIRQMEWARELGIRWCEHQASYSWGRPGKWENDSYTGAAQELTLAPEEP